MAINKDGRGNIDFGVLVSPHFFGGDAPSVFSNLKARDAESVRIHRDMVIEDHGSGGVTLRGSLHRNAPEDFAGSGIGTDERFGIEREDLANTRERPDHQR